MATIDPGNNKNDTVTNKMITASSLGSVTQQASGMNHTNYYNELLFMKCTYINHT